MNQQLSLDMRAVPTRFRTQADAVAWLKLQGYKISKASFSGHVKAGKIGTDGDGFFTSSALLGYAGVHLDPVVKIDDAKGREAAMAKMNADSELKAVRAERERLKLDQERGRLMLVEKHEEELAARALYFRNSLESFIDHEGAAFIDFVHGDQTMFAQLTHRWRLKMAELMDAWASGVDFAETVDIDSADIVDDVVTSEVMEDLPCN